jgi:hypothetical protein
MRYNYISDSETIIWRHITPPSSTRFKLTAIVANNEQDERYLDSIAIAVKHNRKTLSYYRTNHEVVWNVQTISNE